MNYMNIQPPSPIKALITALTWPVKFTTYTSSLWRLWPCSVIIRDAGTRKGPGGQTLLKGTEKFLIMLKSIPWNLEGQLHSSYAKFLPIIFLGLLSSYPFFTRTCTHLNV